MALVYKKTGGGIFPIIVQSPPAVHKQCHFRSGVTRYKGTLGY